MAATTDAAPRESRYRVFAGIRASDWVLAAALTLAGAALMYLNLTATPAEIDAELAAGNLVHAPEPASWLLIPAFALATVPILWWRRSPLVVAIVSLCAITLHVLAFGWIIRCGAALPLAFGLAYLGTLQERSWRMPATVATSMVLVAVVLTRDATTGFAPWPLCLAMLVLAVVFGRLARRRDDAIVLLQARTDELYRVREERAALEVAEDRARVSRQVNDLISARLARLATLAESTRGRPDPVVRTAFEVIETESRRALDDTREVVGVLRGDLVDLIPPATAEQLADRLQRVDEAV